MSVSAVNIRISGRDDFMCPVGESVEAVVDAIRSGRGLEYGEIQKNGVVMFPHHCITADGGYNFVHFHELKGM
jgi:hypothetical protein